jgi:hypothetical protein
MANVDLYINVTTGQTAASTTDASIAPLPAFVQGDTINFRVYLIQTTGRFVAPTRVATTDLTLQMALGRKVGNATEYYTQNLTTWDENEDDASDPYWSGQLPMNTEAIDDLIGSATFGEATFEVKLIIDGLPTTVLSKSVRIQAAVIKEGGFTEPTEPTPMSVEVANALYVKQSGFQGTLRLISPDGTKQADLYYGDDGALHVDPIT